MSTICVIALFGSGLVIGVMWREAFELFLGRDDPMNLWRRLGNLRRRVLAHRSNVATWAICLSMFFPAVVGVALIIDFHERGDLAACVARYQRSEAQVRNDRLDAQDPAANTQIADVESNIAYLHRIEAAAINGNKTIALSAVGDRIEALMAYRDALLVQQHVRATTKYPPPDYCS